jgi:hypothetical protein
VISGAATAASGHVAHRQHKRLARENGAATVPKAAASNDLVSSIQQLAELRASGILSDKEFTAAKAKLLAR